MIDISRLTNDIFDDARLSDGKLRTYADDHLLRLANNNPGAVYAPLITDTTAAYNAYYGAMSDEVNKEAMTEGLTITMNTAKDAVLAKLSSQRDLVAYKFGDTSAIYQQFFPQGLNEYNRAPLDELITILDRYLAAATTHLTLDFPAEVTEVGNLITAYKDARTAQRNAFSETDALRTDRREARKALTRQLTKNILTLAIDFMEDLDNFDDYYDAELLPIGSTGGGTDDGGDTDPPASITRVTGTITDAVAGTFLSGVEVQLSAAEFSVSVFTTDQGTYLFELPEVVSPVNANLQVSLAGYVTLNTPLTLEQGVEYEENVALQPEMP